MLGPRTARCELVRYFFFDFIGAGAVRNFESFFGHGAERSNFWNILWFWCGAEIILVLERCGTKISSPVLGPTGTGAWIPDIND